MSWSEVTITQSGERILSRMLNGAKLIFTRVVIGSETVNEQALPAQTSVFAPIDVPALIAEKTEIEGKNGTQIKIQIRNDGVTETTRMKQIGLYAKTEHDDEVLFGILQDEIGEEIPTFANFSQFQIELWTVVAISRTNNIQIVESPLVYVTVERLKEVQDKLETEIAESTSNEDFREFAQTHGRKEIARRLRDPHKPDYGLDEERITLLTATPSENSEITAKFSGKEYEVSNMRQSSHTAGDGDIIIRKE